MIGRFLGSIDPDILDRLSKIVVFLILVSAFVRGFFVGKISDDTFANAVLIVLGYFFGRASVAKTPGDTTTTTTTTTKPPEVKS